MTIKIPPGRWKGKEVEMGLLDGFRRQRKRPWGGEEELEVWPIILVGDSGNLPGAEEGALRTVLDNFTIRAVREAPDAVHEAVKIINTGETGSRDKRRDLGLLKGGLISAIEQGRVGRGVANFLLVAAYYRTGLLPDNLRENADWLAFEIAQEAGEVAGSYERYGPDDRYTAWRTIELELRGEEGEVSMMLNLNVRRKGSRELNRAFDRFERDGSIGALISALKRARRQGLVDPRILRILALKGIDWMRVQ